MIFIDFSILAAELHSYHSNLQFMEKLWRYSRFVEERGENYWLLRRQPGLHCAPCWTGTLEWSWYGDINYDRIYLNIYKANSVFKSTVSVTFEKISVLFYADSFRTSSWNTSYIINWTVYYFSNKSRMLYYSCSWKKLVQIIRIFCNWNFKYSAKTTGTK